MIFPLKIKPLQFNNDSLVWSGIDVDWSGIPMDSTDLCCGKMWLKRHGREVWYDDYLYSTRSECSISDMCVSF